LASLSISTLFPYTTLFRSVVDATAVNAGLVALDTGSDEREDATIIEDAAPTLVAGLVTCHNALVQGDCSEAVIDSSTAAAAGPIVAHTAPGQGERGVPFIVDASTTLALITGDRAFGQRHASIVEETRACTSAVSNRDPSQFRPGDTAGYGHDGSAPPAVKY